MPRLAVQSAIPAGGPDTLNIRGGAIDNGAPYDAEFIGMTEHLYMVFHLTAGTASLRPYYWFDGNWIGLGADAGAPSDPGVGNSAQFGGVSQTRWSAPGAGAYWCLVREAGAGNPDKAYLDVDRVPET